MGCDGSYESNKDEMVTELKTYDNDTSSCPSSACVFVAVGEAGIILTSSDGNSWTSRTSGTSQGLKSVSYRDNTFVAVGSSGTILTSSDGTSWTSITSGTSNNLSDISYGGGTFVAVSNLGTTHSSSDGNSWTSITSGYSNSLVGVTYSLSPQN